MSLGQGTAAAMVGSLERGRHGYSSYQPWTQPWAPTRVQGESQRNLGPPLLAVLLFCLHAFVRLFSHGTFFLLHVWAYLRLRLGPMLTFP